MINLKKNLRERKNMSYKFASRGNKIFCREVLRQFNICNFKWQKNSQKIYADMPGYILNLDQIE